MQDKELEEIANDIWDKHKKALELLIDNKPNFNDQLSSVLCSNSFLEQVNNKFLDKKVPITIELESQSKRYLVYAVKEWDRFDDIRKSKGWSKSGRILLLEIDMGGGKIYSKMVLGPGDQEVRRTIFSFLEPVQQIKTNRGLSNTWTVLSGKKLFTPDEVEKLVDNFETIGSKELSKAVEDYMIETLPLYNDAILEAHRLEQLK